MKLEISDEALQEIAQTEMQKAIANGLGNYDVRAKVMEAVVKAVDVPAVGATIEAAMADVDWAGIEKRVVHVFGDMVLRSVKAIMGRAVIQVLLDMENIPSYEHDKAQKRRAELEKELGLKPGDADAPPDNPF